MAPGTLDISGTTTESEVCLAWTERGGPAVDPPKGERLRQQAA